MSPEIVFGGRSVSVKTLSGESATVTVRTLRISELPKYFDLMEADENLAAFLTGKDSDFIATLHPTSVLDVVETGHEINFPTAQRWAERRARNIEALGPIQRRVEGKVSPNSAPTAG